MSIRIIYSVIGVTLLVPSMALAAWWNPFTWFNNWTFSDPVEEVHVVQLEQRVQELEAQLQSQQSPEKEAVASTTASSSIGHLTTKATSTAPEPVEQTPVTYEPSKPAPIVPTPTPVVPVQAQAIQLYAPPAPAKLDVCVNIEGLQTVVPDGYTSSAGVCTLIPKVDRCPNIPGAQEKVPEELVLHRASGECMTGDEIDALLDQKSEEDRAEERCYEVKEQAVELSEQKADALAEHNLRRAEIESNSQGRSWSAVTDILHEEDARYGVVLDALNAELSTVNYEVRLYCD